MNRGVVFLAALWIFALHVSSMWAQVTPLQVTGDPTRRVDLLILGDGYTSAELGKFAADVDLFMSGVFVQEPFREYRSYFNVRRIDTASAESGVDHPERTPPVVRNTAFDASYNCSGIQRLICVSTAKVLNAASAAPPSQRDLILVIVNDNEYGGAGGAVAVASTNAAAVELIMHETGHTFAFLADEYTTQPPTCADAAEPAEANATRETNRETLKWRAWVESGTTLPTPTTALGVPGLYLGSRYCPTSLYRPTFDSKMRSLGRSYDAINTERFVRRFYDFALPIETRVPASTALILKQGQTQEFSVTTPEPTTHALEVTWQLDGQSVASGPAYTLSSATLGAGIHTLSATASDPTPLVRTDPSEVLRQETSWTVTVNAAEPLTYTLPANGGSGTITGGTGELVVGHGRARQTTGAHSALAIFRYRQDGVTVAEAAVPGSAKLTSGRIYAEIGESVNTGIAISNPGETDAAVSFFFTNTVGSTSPTNSVTIPARTQMSKFLDESPFDAPRGFSGTLTFNASAPVGVIALRSLVNERGDFLLTTLPVVNLAAPSSAASLVFPHFVSGSGWKTSLILVNPGDQLLAGSLTFRDATTGAPLLLTVDGQTAASFKYTIEPRGARSLSTSGGAPLQSGSVQLVPDAGNSTPVGLLVFSYRPAGVTVSEAGVSATTVNDAFLLYAEGSGAFGQLNSVQPGVALANTSSTPVTVTLELRNMQGQLLGQGAVVAPANGQLSAFLNQIPGFQAVALPYQGRLRASAPSASIAMVGLLGRYNERGDFLITTTPPTAENAPALAEQLFPHFVDGGGYTTQFIFLNSQPQAVSTGDLLFFSQTGEPIFPVTP